jgi:steroid delta-isomerase-like uncharacterized protein
MRQTSPEENKALVHRFVEVVNAGNYDLLDALVAADFVRHCQATPGVHVRSLADFKRFAADDRATFPDQHIDIQQLVAEGDRVAFYCQYAGTQRGPMGPFPPSGRRMEIDFAGVFRVAEGKLAELWVTWDNLAGLVQLGHFPPPAPQG